MNTTSENYGEAYALAAFFYLARDKPILEDYSFVHHVNTSFGRDASFFLEMNPSDNSGNGKEFQRSVSLRKNYLPRSNLPDGILEMELMSEHYDDEFKKEKWARSDLLIPKQFLKSNRQEL